MSAVHKGIYVFYVKKSIQRCKDFLQILPTLWLDSIGYQSYIQVRALVRFFFESVDEEDPILPHNECDGSD